jgi:hypothetical protein
LGEDQTEEAFVKKTLAPFLGEHGIYPAPTLLYTKRHRSGGGARGGAWAWQQIRRNLLLTHDGNAGITTLLDFYGLPEDFPGHPEIRKLSGSCNQVIALQQRFFGV